ncbi:helix-turn-helix domain-containing protein [Nocardioides kribbensis]|uniref:helix-turn-helix domain-containing protein n=1 Tax=Nocardioides kribbensis TaxID=305517 RepID=UPI0032DBD4FC
MADTGPEELAVLALVSRGLTVTAVARRLDVSERTVRRRLRTAADDLGVDSTIEAVVAAVRRRLI